MKRNFAFILAVLFTIFTLPTNGWTAIAEEKTYNDIKDGKYDITAKAMHATDDKASGAAGFLNEDAKLTIKDGKAELTVGVPHKDGSSIDGIQVEGVEAEVKKTDNVYYHTFKLSSLNAELISQIQYSVPDYNMYEENEPFRFILEGLDDLPVKESIPAESNDQASNSEDSNTEEKPETEEIISDEINLDNGYYTTKVNYIRIDNNDSSSMGRYLNESVFINSKDGTYYLTITVNDDETVTQLKINNKIAEQKVVEGDNRYETFKFDNLNSLLDAYVEYQAPYKGSVHKGNADFRIVLDNEFISVKAEDQPGYSVDNNVEKPELETNPEVKPVTEQKPKTQEPKKEEATLTPDKAFEIDYQIKHENGRDLSAANNFFVKPGNLLIKDDISYVQFTINNGDMVKDLSTKYGEVLIVKENKDGSVVVQFKVNDNLSNIDLKMNVVVPGMYNTEHKAILEFNKQSKKEIKANQFKLAASKSVNGPNPIKGEPIAKPINKDSKDKKKTNKINKEKNKSKVNNSKITETNNSNALTPDKAYSINYTIKHEDGIKTSVADDFFIKPGKILEKDGVLYAQFTITNGNMVKQLSTEFGDALVVKKNKDGSIVVQFKVKKDLSNMKLNMLIDVPGLYTEEHSAILVFDKSSITEIDPNKEKLVASNSDNGPTVKNGIESSTLSSSDDKDKLIPFGKNLDNKDVDKPIFGSNDEKQKTQINKSKNPQTGDTSAIWLYTLLLFGSLITLGINFKRRTI